MNLNDLLNDFGRHVGTMLGAFFSFSFFEKRPRCERSYFAKMAFRGRESSIFVGRVPQEPCKKRTTDGLRSDGFFDQEKERGGGTPML